jgi:glycerol-3-phosphate dehydrogenase
VENTQQVRKRTRAGMGWCQGQYCAPKVKAIIAQELGVSLQTIEGRPWPESSLLEKPHQYADSKQ